MIVDNKKNINLYKNISNEVRLGFEFIESVDFSKLPEGRTDIDGDNIYAVVSSYNTKPIIEGKYEGHKKYIDIQYIVDGSEKMYGMDINTCKSITKYDENKDVEFFEGNSTWQFTAQKETFAVFFPNDIHMPGINNTKIDKVYKVVIKVRVK